jgi:hypothetical protein
MKLQTRKEETIFVAFIHNLGTLLFIFLKQNIKFPLSIFCLYSIIVYLSLVFPTVKLSFLN